MWALSRAAQGIRGQERYSAWAGPGGVEEWGAGRWGRR